MSGLIGSLNGTGLLRLNHLCLMVHGVSTLNHPEHRHGPIPTTHKDNRIENPAFFLLSHPGDSRKKATRFIGTNTFRHQIKNL